MIILSLLRGEEEVVVSNIVRPPCGDRVLSQEEYLKTLEEFRVD